MTSTQPVTTTKTNYYLRALAALAAVGATPAEAAFPGNNGKIAFESERTTGEGVDKAVFADSRHEIAYGAFRFRAPLRTLEPADPARTLRHAA